MSAWGLCAHPNSISILLRIPLLKGIALTWGKT